MCVNDWPPHLRSGHPCSLLCGVICPLVLAWAFIRAYWLSAVRISGFTLRVIALQALLCCAVCRHGGVRYRVQGVLCSLLGGASMAGRGVCSGLCCADALIYLHLLLSGLAQGGSSRPFSSRALHAREMRSLFFGFEVLRLERAVPPAHTPSGTGGQ